ncbi:MAG: hypothetical protein IJI47_01475 [Eubacterium sp.]|nr:hypothetical protein [Eubacterium sp.]
MKNKPTSFGDFMYGLFICLIFRVTSWVCSLPMWITLILHFVIGLSLVWFWATLAVWLIAGLLRYLMIIFGRWGAAVPEIEHENKNPYSNKKE